MSKCLPSACVAGWLLLGSDGVSVAAWQLPAATATATHVPVTAGLTAEAVESRRGDAGAGYLSAGRTVETFESRTS